MSATRQISFPSLQRTADRSLPRLALSAPLCVCYQFIYPAACRPDWIMAAAGFPKLYMTWPNPVPVRKAMRRPAVLWRSLPSCSPAPLLPEKKGKEGRRTYQGEDKGKDTLSQGAGPPSCPIGTAITLFPLPTPLKKPSHRPLSPAGRSAPPE